ncbi:MAG TPA: hypothetical protein VFV73_21205 [Streptosporangiaceae bacterium]|nr:hypothetical protein [Streptosporangiaceae bacterium]
MRLSLKERWSLRRIGKVVQDADPLLAAKLAIFSRLAAGDPMPGHERLPAADNRSREPLMQRHQRAPL